MIYITNAFSINILSKEEHRISFKPVTVEEVTAILNFYDDVVGAIGHKDTASIVENIIGVPNLHNRINIKLENNDIMLVAQYSGPRLEEGATQLPKDAQIDFWLVYLISFADPPVT